MQLPLIAFTRSRQTSELYHINETQCLLQIETVANANSTPYTRRIIHHQSAHAYTTHTYMHTYTNSTTHLDVHTYEILTRLILPVYFLHILLKIFNVFNSLYEVFNISQNNSSIMTRVHLSRMRVSLTQYNIDRWPSIGQRFIVRISSTNFQWEDILDDVLTMSYISEEATCTP